MPARRPFQTALTPDPETQELLARAKERDVTEEELRAQRVSFAFGNAPADSGITKASVRRAAGRVRLTRG